MSPAGWLFPAVRSETFCSSRFFFGKTWGAKPSSRFAELPRSADRTYLVELRSGIRVGGAIENPATMSARIAWMMPMTRPVHQDQIGVDIVRKSALCSGAPDRDQMPGKTAP